MRDPIGSFDIIKENFLRYVKTAFKTKFESVEAEREVLLNQDKVLYREPWIELLPEYLSSGKYIKDLTTDDLPGLSQKQIDIFKGLVNGNGETGLAPEYFKLHDHQTKMLKQALAGKNCIITSGTGSGKTESFLLPLFAQLAKELAVWNAPDEKSANVDSWWRDDNVLNANEIVNVEGGYTLSEEVQQRGHDNRTPGMRAMIIYPMNALVEDQMTRLRIALDSEPVREWFNTNANNNSIYFGRYNGATPIPGKLEALNDDGTHGINRSKVNRLRKALATIEENANRVEEFINENSKEGKEADELRAFFQRLDGAEMRNRFDMQAAPPDILITNFSMLGIMLMRAIDAPIFETTKSWLNCEDLPEEKREAERPNRVFHLVIDELHLYRGTQGTEVAYLLKLVLKRLGLHPKHSQLKILASSASLDPGDEESLKYVGDFFGFRGIEDVRGNFEIITGEDSPVEPVSNGERQLPTEPFEQVGQAYIESGGNIDSERFETACKNAGNQLRPLITHATNEVSSVEEFLRILLHPQLQVKE